MIASVKVQENKLSHVDHSSHCRANLKPQYVRPDRAACVGGPTAPHRSGHIQVSCEASAGERAHTPVSARGPFSSLSLPFCPAGAPPPPPSIHLRCRSRPVQPSHAWTSLGIHSGCFLFTALASFLPRSRFPDVSLHPHISISSLITARP